MTAGRVERVVGGPPLALQLAGLDVPVQLENADQPGRLEGTHGPVTVRRWRSDVDSRPDAATCSTTVTARALAAAGYVGPPQLGDQLVVELSAAARAAFGFGAAGDTVNLVDDPAFRQLGRPGQDWWAWWADAGFGVREARTGSAGWAHGLTTAGRVTWSSDTTLGAGGGIGTFDTVVEPGRPLKVRSQIRVSKPQRLLLWVDLANADRSVYAPGLWSTALVDGDQVVELELSADVPAGFVWCDVYAMGNYPASFGGAGSTPFLAGDWLETTGLLVSQDDAPGVPAYFDGGSAGAGVEYAWTGAANASPSSRTVTASKRFVGRLTDVEAIPETIGGGPALYRLAAAGPQARLGRLTIGEPPWPAELDGQRVERVLAAAAAQSADVVAGDVDAGTVTVFARDVDAQGALSLVDELAAAGGGELVELRDGRLEFHDAEHRRNAPALVELLAGEVLSPATWKATLGGLVNDLTLTYGDPESSVQLVDQVAVDGPIGRLAAKLSTQLATLPDAQLRVADIVGRRGRQRWRIDALPVDLVASVDQVKAGKLLASSFGDLVDVAGFPTAGPFATAALWIEGQTETITARSWRLELAVSEYGLTAPAPRFVDVDDDVAIGDVPDDVSIVGAVSWWPAGARTSSGRFVDVPAGLDFRDVPDAELIGSTTY